MDNSAELAQSVERTTLNRVVVGSIPTFGVSFIIPFCPDVAKFLPISYLHFQKFNFFRWEGGAGLLKSDNYESSRLYMLPCQAIL